VRPRPETPDHYAPLVTKGVIRLGSATTADLERLPRYEVPTDMSPLDLLLAEREDDWRGQVISSVVACGKCPT
jgi:hypothetical protein